MLLHCTQCQLTMGGTETKPLGEFRPPAPELALAIPGFEVREEIGRGGMGIVYRAYRKSLDQEVAIKVLPQAMALDPRLLSRFRNEAKIGATLIDSHVLPVFDVQDVQGVPVIVMPLIKGTNLGNILSDRTKVKKGKAPADPHAWAMLDDRKYLDKVLPVLDQVVAGVVALHRRDILHRDIKPSNVLLDEHGNAWLSDFGLARLAGSGQGTHPGMEIGTRGYASPEQARGDEVDLRADVFSLGATLYAALTLELPFASGWIKRGAATPVLPSRRQPALGTKDYDAVLLKALEVEPTDRYGSVAEMAEDWQRVRAGLLPRAQRAGPVRRSIRAARRHPAAVVAGLAILVLFAFLGVMFLPRITGRSDAATKRDAGELIVPMPPEPAQEPALRTVHVDTEPAGARIALVPIHRLTGFPLPDKAIRPKELTPLTLKEVPAGEYLVVADVIGHGFHEVYRTVPRPKQGTVGGFPQLSSEERADGSVDFPRVNIPGAEVLKGMAFFTGGQFTMGSPEQPDAPPHQQIVPAFYLDATEVTADAFRKETQGIPKRIKNLPGKEPVRFVTFDQALNYAEKIGKRLPDEAEYEFAATNGGTTRFPWGDEDPEMTTWQFGPAGQPAFDHTKTKPPVYGLFSNVAEWTLSWHTLAPGNQAPVEQFYSPEMQVRFAGARIVRGGPFSVLGGNSDLRIRAGDGQWNPRHRHSISRDLHHPGLGFRCARSAQPRFLDR
jgi:formylglycine-generating enzyme required for sulfatase activity/tRNA A-37 threonylcarbamoyl transferase component Bud32